MTQPTPGRGFAMVPAWLVWKKPSVNALTVYIHLALYGTFNPGSATYEQCRPSKKTLASGDPRRGYPGTGLSESTVGRALRELETLGAIKGEASFNPANGAQEPTVYRLVFGQVTEETAAQTPVSPVTPPPPMSPVTPGGSVTHDTPRGVTHDRGPRVTGDEGPVSPVTHNQEPSTKNQGTKNQEQNPPPPSTATSGGAGADAPGGDSSPTSNPAPADGLAKLVASLVEMAPGWNPSETRSVLEALRTRGTDPAEIARVATEVASGQHGETRSPRRMLKWWPTTAAAPVAVEPEWAKAPMNHLRLDAPRCPRHQGQPRLGCNPCAGEAKAAVLDAPSVLATDLLDRESAREIARAEAARVRKGGASQRPRRPEMIPAATTPDPTPFGAMLAQVAESVNAGAA